jgi:ribosomal protein S21
MKPRIEQLIYTKRIYDDPIVVVREDLSKSIKALKIRVSKLGTFQTLKNRRLHASKYDRRRSKRKKAEQRLLAKQQKQNRR